ncbi:MAG: hypothetical protein IJV31_01045 [Clostridia bacterium]|nr:hypothetical protein [Clostridia bacterium]MBQ9657337.1 hypothetical protein [Clostridia bacterium]
MEEDKRVTFNTTIRKSTADMFRSYCKENSLPMNTVMETFFKQFADGEFIVKIGNGTMKLELSDSEK